LSNEIELARAIRDAVQLVPGVAALGSGSAGEVGTYGPGEKIVGVAVQPDRASLRCDIHLWANYEKSLRLPHLADRVRRVVRQTAKGLGTVPVGKVDVSIEDVVMEDSKQLPWHFSTG
jgi:uncharacterized alkaline shock family protein YloU